MIPYRKVEDCPERERKKLNEKIKIEFEKEFSAASELEGLEMKFLQLDKNGDSKLTKNEMKPIFDLRTWFSIFLNYFSTTLTEKLY